MYFFPKIDVYQYIQLEIHVILKTIEELGNCPHCRKASGPGDLVVYSNPQGSLVLLEVCCKMLQDAQLQ